MILMELRIHISQIIFEKVAMQTKWLGNYYQYVKNVLGSDPGFCIKMSHTYEIIANFLFFFIIISIIQN